MSTSANAREVRRQRRFEKLTSSDAQLIAAQPDPAVTGRTRGPRSAAHRCDPHRDGRLCRPARARSARGRIRHRRRRPHRCAVAAPFRHLDLPRDLDACAGPRRRAGRQPCAARRPRRNARLQQCRLRDRGHGTVADRRRRGATADQRSGKTTAPDPARDRTGRDPLQRRPPPGRRRARAHRATPPSAWSCSTTTRRSTTTARRSNPPRRAWPATTSPSTCSTTSSRCASAHRRARYRSRRQRCATPADLYLRLHRNAERRDVHRPPDGQLLAGLGQT